MQAHTNFNTCLNLNYSVPFMQAGISIMMKRHNVRANGLFSFLAFGLSANNTGGLPGVLQTLILGNENFIRDIETLYQIELTDNFVKILAETILVLSPNSNEVTNLITQQYSFDLV